MLQKFKINAKTFILGTTQRLFGSHYLLIIKLKYILNSLFLNSPFNIITDCLNMHTHLNCIPLGALTFVIWMYWSIFQSLSFIYQIQYIFTYFFLNDLFLYIAIDTVFHPSGIIQNGRRKLLSKSQSCSNHMMKRLFSFLVKKQSYHFNNCFVNLKK